MSRRTITNAAVLATTVLMAFATAVPCSADPCTTQDRKIIEFRVQQAVVALMGGDVPRYVELLQTPDPGLSPACRAAQERLNPASTRCTSSERKLVLEHYSAAMVAAGSGDLVGMLGVMEALQAALTPACWTAVNYPQDPGVLAACSTAELNVLASTAKDSLPAVRRLFTTGDFSALVQLSTGALAQLSAQCGAAVARAQQAAQQRTGAGAGAGYQLPNVYDHGGGTYSVPGVGACGPSGCIPF